MAHPAKTTAAPLTVEAFLDTVTPPARQAGARRLVTLVTEVTGSAPCIHP